MDDTQGDLEGDSLEWLQDSIIESQFNPSHKSNYEQSTTNSNKVQIQNNLFPGTTKVSSVGSIPASESAEPNFNNLKNSQEKVLTQSDTIELKSTSTNHKDYINDPKESQPKNSDLQKSAEVSIETNQNALKFHDPFGKTPPFQKSDKAQTLTENKKKINYYNTSFSESKAFNSINLTISSILTKKDILLSQSGDYQSTKEKNPINQFPNPNYFDKSPTSTNQVKNIKNLVTLLVKSVKLTDLQGKPINASITLLDTQSAKTLNCRKCQNFLIAIKTECGHSECFTCYQLSLETLLQNPNFLNYSKCSCSICGTTSSTEFMMRFFPEKASEIQQLSLLRTCVWCKRELDLFKPTFPNELKCKHLCDICYLNEVFFDSKACLCCGSGFKNLEITLKRSAVCVNCNKSGYFIQEGYRTTSKNEAYCLKCLETLLSSDSTLSLSKNELIILRSSVNVICPKCSKAVHVVEINKCATCQSFICESCNNSSSCYLCEQSYS